MKKVLCIGHAAYDITLVFDEFPKENTKVRTEIKVESSGGSALNGAHLLAKWGMDTYFAGLVGNDVYGNKIRKEIEHSGVKTQYMQVDKAMETTTSFIAVNDSKKTRTILTYRNSKAKMKKSKIKIKPNYIYVDGEDCEVALEQIKKNKKAISILDAGKNKPNIIKLAKVVDYVVGSKNFAEDYTGIKIDFNNKQSIINIFNILEKSFKGHIVITVEDKGCLYKESESIKLMPGYKVDEVKDTTGAGDIFHGAFVYALMNAYSYEDILKIANITGALSVTKIGSNNSIPKLEEVLEIYEKSK